LNPCRSAVIVVPCELPCKDPTDSNE